MKINEDIESVLKTYKKVAIVGISGKSYRPSYGVASFLKLKGYHIYPVNPGLDTVLGEKCYQSLLDIAEPVEIVDIFRRPEYVDEIVDQAIKIGAKVVWMQLGVINEKAARKALEAGMAVVMDRCMKIENKKWIK
ncbi:MAG: CoA-binding protein [Calditrichia bacterium]